MAGEQYWSVLGRPVELSDERRTHILDRHPSVAPFLERIGEVLLRPEAVRRSTYDPEVLPFSRFHPDGLGGKHLVVVVKLGGRCFVLTAYLTRRLAGGQPYEGEHPVLV